MKLCRKGIEDRKVWEEKGYVMPQFDIDKMIERTKAAPTWVHFGGGNLFRMFHAVLAQRLLDAGLADTGIIVAEGFDYEIATKMYQAHDNLGIAVTLKSDGTIDKRVVASVAEAIPLDSDNDTAFNRMLEVFAAPSLQMATFTITEKGYALVNGKGETPADIAADYAAGPGKPASYMGKVTALLYHRFKAGALPIAMVSTDNCSHNGDKLYDAVIAFAEHWQDQGFVDYLKSDKVSFTWSMIDKITPRPDASVEAILRKDGVEELDPVITSRKSYVAPFVNAEETEYLVIEDKFPNGKPALDKVGVMFTDRETVDKVEKMKVCTCLNPLHTCLAVFGCLLGYTKISDEMKDEDLVSLIKTVGYKEGLPVVINPGVLDPKTFIDTVIGVRLPNPFMPDTPQRIATDTSQKLAIRFGETVKAYGDKAAAELHLIPLLYAGWLRYLMGIDDKGETFELSPDPLLDTVRPYLAEIKLGDNEVADKVRPILSNTAIFGVDLYAVGLADKAASYFTEMIKAPGAVRDTLHRAVG